MTKRQGTLWKSAWKRRGAYGSGTPKGVWFVDLRPSEPGFNRYATAAPAPFAFQSVPFWIGWMWTRGSSDNFLFISEVLQSSGTTVARSFSLQNAASEFQFNLAPVETLFRSTESYLAAWPEGSVVVSFAAVQQVGPDVKVDLWMDGGRRGSAIYPSVSYVVPLDVARVAADISVNALALNFAAGSGVPTEDQIRTWFAEVRNSARIQPIPGLTTDMFDAEVAAPGPVPPDPFPNTGGGQQWQLENLLGDAPVLVLKEVIFNY